MCLFVRPAFVKNPELLARLLNARYGWTLDVQGRARHGAQVPAGRSGSSTRSAPGYRTSGCDVPEFMRSEPLPPHGSVFDVPREEMRHIWELTLPEDVF